MIREIGTQEAEALIASGEIELVDVREPDEWARGHISGARLVPLGQLQADAAACSIKDKILFVCAKGSRSMTAAKIAERHGLGEIYNLRGGTEAWIQAGLPVEKPGAPGPAPRPESSSPRDRSMDACAIPDAGLDAVVAANVRELRAARGISLDALAGSTQLSRALLGQIELGRTSVGVNVLWKIARAFDVPFSALLATPSSASLGAPRDVTTWISHGQDAKRMVSADGRYSSRALFSPGSPFFPGEPATAGERQRVEFYELWLAGHAREDAEAHHPGTRENLVVASGRLQLEFRAERIELAKGDAIAFAADVPHSYANLASQECWMYLVMTYAAPGSSSSRPA